MRRAAFFMAAQRERERMDEVAAPTGTPTPL
jgi:hypothetical protein